MHEDGVVAAAFELIEIDDARPYLDVAGPETPWSDAEISYARSKSDPERRLAARLAAKRAALRLLGDGFALGDAEVRRAPGSAPWLRLSARAVSRLRELGGERVMLSLTHGRRHAAACVLFLLG